MNGARQYADMFKTGQIDRLYIVSGSHARGKTFHIYVLPEGAAAKPNGSSNGPLNSDAVEVYGVIGGQPGWTESYGWLHKGRWQDDFAKLVAARKAEIEASTNTRAESQKQRDNEAAVKRTALLAAYEATQ